MRTAVFFLMVLLAGCDGYGARRYELVSAAGGVYLLDTKTGRVWAYDHGDFAPKRIMRDSSVLAELTRPTDPNTTKFLKENYAYQPNTWGDFFRGLVK